MLDPSLLDGQGDVSDGRDLFTLYCKRAWGGSVRCLGWISKVPGVDQ